MNIVVTERDKKLLRLVVCLAIIVIFGMYLIRPAMENHETLQNEYDAAEQKQQEYQTQIATLATIDDIIAASEKYYKSDLETRQMDDIITGIALENGLFPQSLTLTEAAPGAVSAYLTEQEAAQTDSSADTSSDTESADSTDDTSAAPVQPVNCVYIGTATISAQGAVTQWLNFLDEVEHRYKGLRVTNFSIADYDYVENNTQAVSTNLITGTLEIYMCVSDKEADA